MFERVLTMSLSGCLTMGVVNYGVSVKVNNFFAYSLGCFFLLPTPFYTSTPVTLTPLLPSHSVIPPPLPLSSIFPPTIVPVPQFNMPPDSHLHPIFYTPEPLAGTAQCMHDAHHITVSLTILNISPTAIVRSYVMYPRKGIQVSEVFVP